VNADADSGQTQEETSSTAQTDTTEVGEVKALKAELYAWLLTLITSVNASPKKVSAVRKRKRKPLFWNYYRSLTIWNAHLAAVNLLPENSSYKVWR
jgi:hypothetical protein